MIRPSKYIFNLNIINILSLLALLLISLLSNLLPINGRFAGEVANYYNPLFHPADFTSNIWIAIYGLLVAFVIFILRKLKSSMEYSSSIVSGIGLSFMTACMTNLGWIIAWHYEHLLTTVILSFILLLSLIDINRRVRKIDNSFSQTPSSFRWWVKVPFGLYLGWVAVVFIANMSIYLIANGWEQEVFSQKVWAIIFIFFVGILGLYLVHWLKTLAPALAIIWGLFGLLVTFFQNDTNTYLQISAIIMIALIAIGSARFHQKINSIHQKS